MEGMDIAVPSIFLIAPGGTIVWRDIGERVDDLVDGRVGELGVQGQAQGALVVVVGATVRFGDVDPRTGRRTRRFGLPGNEGLDAFAATSDDRAVYAFLARAHWLIAIPR